MCPNLLLEYELLEYTPDEQSGWVKINSILIQGWVIKIPSKMVK